MASTDKATAFPYRPYESIALRLRDNQQRYDACSLYVHGQRKLARQFLPDYISSLEKRAARKTDFLIGMAFFVLTILGLAYFVLPHISNPYLSVLALVAGSAVTFYSIENTTKRVRLHRLVRYMLTKEMPRLKREIDSQRSGIETIISEKKRRKKPASGSQPPGGRQGEAERQRRHNKGSATEDPFAKETGERFNVSEGSMTEEDAHRILGLAPNCSPDDVQRAYREAIRQYHPDRVAHLAEEFRLLAEKRTKLINRAYEILRRTAE